MISKSSALRAPKEFVPSASSRILRGGHKRLIALLGTCVGVAIFDSEAGIGGIHHILLPEPTGTTNPWEPDTYATTGLPLFIEALIEAGADRSRLRAVVAGGALFGVKTKLDLDLDIGGKTSEVVMRILAEKKIPVIHAETGGYMGAQLELDTTDWQYEVQPILSRPEDVPSPIRPVLPEEVHQAISRIEPIPQVSLKIMRLARQGGYHFNDLVTEVHSDQVLSARVLRFCNSSFIGTRHPIESLNHALVLLGEDLLLEVVMSSGTELFFSSHNKGGYSLMRGGMFVHSQVVAQIAAVLAEFTGEVDRHAAYTAGLLHDIGMVVLDQYTGAGSPYFHVNTSRKRDLIRVEKEMFGVDHQQVGRQLARSWKLPRSLVEAISCHHVPETAEHDWKLAHVIHLANLLANNFLTGIATDSFSGETLLRRLNRLNLVPSQLPEIIDRVPWSRFQSIHGRESSGSQ